MALRSVRTDAERLLQLTFLTMHEIVHGVNGRKAVMDLIHRDIRVARV